MTDKKDSAKNERLTTLITEELPTNAVGALVEGELYNRVLTALEEVKAISPKGFISRTNLGAYIGVDLPQGTWRKDAQGNNVPIFIPLNSVINSLEDDKRIERYEQVIRKGQRKGAGKSSEYYFRLK